MSRIRLDRVRRAVHEVRLIGGLWKRSKLPVADRPGLRPTPDRVRETLFNWLGQDLTGWRCLDAFAGSGALGFEAASRGASNVVMLDQDAEVVQLLKSSQQRLGAVQVQIERAEAMAWMRRSAARSFDLVFLDPPFQANLLQSAFDAAAALVSDAGHLYVEGHEPMKQAMAGFELWRSGRAGAVHFHLLRRSS